MLNDIFILLFAREGESETRWRHRGVRDDGQGLEEGVKGVRTRKCETEAREPPESDAPDFCFF